MAILIINSSNSLCGACGRGTSPYASKHDEEIGWTPGPGCGAVFTQLSTDYAGMEQERRIREMRPDLEYVGIEWGPIYNS